MLDQGTCIDPSYVAHDAIDQSNTSGSQENIGKYTGDIARTVVTNAYNYNRTTKMTTLKESNIDKLVIICMVIFFLFILFFQLEFGCSRTAGEKVFVSIRQVKEQHCAKFFPCLLHY